MIIQIAILLKIKYLIEIESRGKTQLFFWNQLFNKNKIRFQFSLLLGRNFESKNQYPFTFLDCTFTWPMRNNQSIILGGVHLNLRKIEERQRDREYKVQRQAVKRTETCQFSYPRHINSKLKTVFITSQSSSEFSDNDINSHTLQLRSGVWCLFLLLFLRVALLVCNWPRKSMDLRMQLGSRKD